MLQAATALLASSKTLLSSKSVDLANAAPSDTEERAETQIVLCCRAFWCWSTRSYEEPLGCSVATEGETTRSQTPAQFVFPPRGGGRQHGGGRGEQAEEGCQELRGGSWGTLEGQLR